MVHTVVTRIGEQLSRYAQDISYLFRLPVSGMSVNSHQTGDLVQFAQLGAEPWNQAACGFLFGPDFRQTGIHRRLEKSPPKAFQSYLIVMVVGCLGYDIPAIDRNIGSERLTPVGNISGRIEGEADMMPVTFHDG